MVSRKKLWLSSIFHIIFIIYAFQYFKFYEILKRQSAYLYPYILFDIFFNNVAESQFTKECYDFINGEQHRNRVKDCFVHSNYRHLLCCHFGIAPSQANISRILILGSAGKIGLSFIKLLKEKKIDFIEIRGRLHFDLKKDQIYEIFNSVKISHVFDLVKNENESIHEKIYSYFNQKKIIVTRVVENQVDSKYDQIIAQTAFGNQYMKINVSQLFNHTFYCIVENKCPKTISFSNDISYALSNEISIELFNCLSHKKPQIVKPTFSTFTEQQIWEKVLSYKQKTMTKNDKLFPVLDDIYNASLERQKKPFLTVSYSVTNDYLHYNKALNTIALYEKVCELYPDINLEIIFFWVMQNETSITEVKTKSSLKSRLHVIVVSNKDETLLRNTLDTGVIPEYFYRNIGVRLGKGDLLMSGSSDVFPSLSFFEIVQRKLVGPFTLLKNLRNEANSFEEVLGNYINKRSYFGSKLDVTGSPCDFGYYAINAGGPSGDLQGSLRTTMFKLNGWVFDKYTWAVDTAFCWDFMMFKVPTHYVVYVNTHQEHPTLSFYAPHFQINRRYRKNNMLFCNGIPTKFHNVGKRPNWGVSFDFPSNDLSKGQFGHLRYNLIPNKNNTVEYASYRLVFNVFYDNNKY